MAFMGIFLLFLPALAAVIGIIIALFAFIGTCLLIMGITGRIMSKIYMRQTNDVNGITNPLYNNTSIVLGAVFILFPLGVTLHGIISLLTLTL